MDLQRVLDSLAAGELQNTTYVDEKKGVIKPAKYKNVINSINLALMQLYTYFNITEKEVHIQQLEGITEYKLDPVHSVNNVAPDVLKFIVDSVDSPFVEDILRVNYAYDETGEQIPVNDLDAANSIFLPTFNVVQIPNPVATNIVSLVYTARAQKISLDETDTTLMLGVPDTLLEALVLYTASRLIGSLTSQDSQVRSSQLLTLYHAEIRRIEDYNLYNTGDSCSNNKLDERGYV